MLRINISGVNPPLRQAAKRYRKPYDDSANIKQTDFDNIFRQPWTTTDSASKANASGKKTKKIATARKNSNATAHCTHLPLPAHAQANAKAKSKECNLQRFEKFSVQNYIFAYF